MAGDELTRLRAENVRLKNELDKQLNAWGGYVDAHAGNYSRMNARIAELEKTVARLEADNKRLRHLDAMPLDALERFHDEANMVDPVYVESGQFDDDHGAIREWLTSLDGDA